MLVEIVLAGTGRAGREQVMADSEIELAFLLDTPLHIPRMAEPSVDATLFRAPNEAVSEFEGATSELVLMGRSLKALKVIVKISNESMRSSEALVATQQTIVNLLRKQVDIALLNGNSGANSEGVIPQAGTTIVHSRKVNGGFTNTDTSLVSATAAFTSADVGNGVSGIGIASGTTIKTVTNATTVVLSTATTTTATRVTVTITSSETILAQMVDALTAAQDAYADPKSWIINAQTIGALRRMTLSLGQPLLSPDTTQQGAEMILGRTVIPAPAATLPHGTAMVGSGGWPRVWSRIPASSGRGMSCFQEA